MSEAERQKETHHGAQQHRGEPLAQNPPQDFGKTSLGRTTKDFALDSKHWPTRAVLSAHGQLYLDNAGDIIDEFTSQLRAVKMVLRDQRAMASAE